MFSFHTNHQDMFGDFYDIFDLCDKGMRLCSFWCGEKLNRWYYDHNQVIL